ncbi:MAG: hypothetical protein AAB692_02155, partial [Patescibacteria group bacterium]
AAFALALIQKTLIEPSSSIAADATLALVVALVLTFRFTEAATAAVASALVHETMSVGPAGQTVVMTAITVAALIFLYTRVFTDLSLAGFVAMTAVAFLFWRGLHGAADALAASLRGTGQPSVSALARSLRLVSGLAVQMIFGAIALAIVRKRDRTSH